MGKKYRTERRRIDASKVAVVIHDRDAVEHYKRHPNRPYDGWGGNGGRPSVGYGSGGRLVAWQGNHRIAAAAAQGRKIDVDFQVEVGAEEKPKGFLDWLFS